MTEAEWLACNNPLALLSGLPRKVGNRKLRLLGCSCCRRSDIVLVHEPLRRATETAERYADAQARYGDMIQAAKAVEAFSWGAEESTAVIARGVWHLVTMGAWWNLSPLRRTARTIRALLATEPSLSPRVVSNARCVFGPIPFRRIRVAPQRLTATIVNLAEGIYEERAFDRLPILADALQEAGCTNDDILDHCRDTSHVHVRGCWVVDLVLGKT
jgi:hypothetical protein